MTMQTLSAGHGVGQAGRTAVAPAVAGPYPPFRLDMGGDEPVTAAL